MSGFFDECFLLERILKENFSPSKILARRLAQKMHLLANSLLGMFFSNQGGYRLKSFSMPEETFQVRCGLAAAIRNSYCCVRNLIGLRTVFNSANVIIIKT